MRQPPGFLDFKFPKHVCRLKKAVYDLKQAPLPGFIDFVAFFSHMVFPAVRLIPLC